jgi:hypothetical protein
MKHTLRSCCVRLAGSAVLASVLAITHPAFAQADTAQAREVFALVNKRLPTLDKVSLVVKLPNVDYKSEVKAWLDAGSVAKLEVTDRDDSGNVFTEYYYARGELVIIYQAVMGFKSAGNSNKMATTSEERYYFRDGKMFKWLSGMGNDKLDVPRASAEFSDEGKSRLASSAVLVRSATAAYAKQPGAKSPK